MGKICIYYQPQNEANRNCYEVMKIKINLRPILSDNRGFEFRCSRGRLKTVTFVITKPNYRPH